MSINKPVEITERNTLADADSVMVLIPGGFLVFFTQPKACRTCRQEHYILVNRYGQTQCIQCDKEAAR